MSLRESVNFGAATFLFGKKVNAPSTKGTNERRCAANGLAASRQASTAPRRGRFSGGPPRRIFIRSTTRSVIVVVVVTVRDAGGNSCSERRRENACATSPPRATSVTERQERSPGIEPTTPNRCTWRNSRRLHVWVCQRFTISSAH